MDKLISRAIKFLVILALIILVVSLATGLLQGHVHR
jgi:hypothetical protein